MQTAVRRGTPADAAGIARLHVLGWQHGYQGLLPQHVLDGLTPDQRVPRWSAQLSNDGWPQRGVLVAHAGDRLLGVAHIGPDRRDATSGEVYSFYVLPTCLGTGVGRALMAGALDALRFAGRTEATLWVLAGNARAIGFYEHLGWRADGATKADEVGGLPILDVRYRIGLR